MKRLLKNLIIFIFQLAIAFALFLGFFYLLGLVFAILENHFWLIIPFAILDTILIIKEI